MRPAPLRPALLLPLALCAACVGPLPAALPERAAPPPPVALSGEAQAVAALAQRLFDAMAARDTTALRALLHPRATFVVVDSAGAVQRLTNLTPWVQSIGASPVPVVERMTAPPRVEVHGPLATLWVPYTLHVGSRFSHCGIDALDAVRENGRWTLLVLTFSMQRTGCEALGGPAASAPR